MISQSEGMEMRVTREKKDFITRDLQRMGIAKVIHFVRIDTFAPRIKRLSDTTIAIDETLLEGESSLEALRNVLYAIQSHLR
jgi:hypothetical protein